LDWLIFGTTANIDEDVRLAILLNILTHHLPKESQIGFTEFIQGIVDVAIQQGRNGATPLDLLTDD